MLAWQGADTFGRKLDRGPHKKARLAPAEGLSNWLIRVGRAGCHLRRPLSG